MGSREIKGGSDMVGFGQTGLESMDLEMASPEEIIANVERMIKQEETKNTAMKKDKRSAEKALDLDVGITPVSAKGAGPTKSGAQSKAADISVTSGGSTAESVETQDDFFAALDEDVTIMRRKTMAIKSDNVQEAILSNLSAIAQSMQTF
jgi:ribosome-associated translation inhibitor RaiA